MSRRKTIQGLKVLAIIIAEIARVNGIVVGRTGGRKPETYVAPCQQVRQKLKTEEKLIIQYTNRTNVDKRKMY